MLSRNFGGFGWFLVIFGGFCWPRIALSGFRKIFIFSCYFFPREIGHIMGFINRIQPELHDAFC